MTKYNIVLEGVWGSAASPTRENKFHTSFVKHNIARGRGGGSVPHKGKHIYLSVRK